MNRETLHRLLAETFYDNTFLEWAGAVALGLVVYGLLSWFRRMAGRSRERAAIEAVDESSGRAWRHAIADAFSRTAKLFVFIAALYAGAYLIDLPEETRRLIGSVFVIALFLQGAVWATRIATLSVQRYAREHAAEDETVGNALSLIQFFIRLGVWSLAALLILDNLGFNITALVAGLGIGGIAIALAAQNILADLFASLSIVLDKPFVKGDFVIFGDYLGTVERIGLKTTRLRSLSGEQIVCANTDLLSARIRNYKRMWERRVVFGLGVVYQTPVEKLEIIPNIIREAIETQESTRFDRAHFKAFGAFSLDFEAVYWVLSPDYAVYMNIQQAINLHIFRRFQEEGIDFAYPTQTIFLGQGDAPPAESRHPRLD